MNVVWRNETLQFLPSYDRLRDVILLVYDIIKEIPLNLKRIEHHLYEKCHTTILLEVRTIHTYMIYQRNKNIFFIYF